MTTTARLGLPLIEPGQAQKEWFHNEALLLLDAAVQAGVRAVGTDVPAVAPVPGDSWVVGAAPVDAWAGHARELAVATAGGWRFVTPVEGMTVWNRATASQWRHVGGMWLSGQAIPTPTGGATIDQEARRTLAELLELLRGQGLVAR